MPVFFPTFYHQSLTRCHLYYDCRVGGNIVNVFMFVNLCVCVCLWAGGDRSFDVFNEGFIHRIKLMILPVYPC